MLTRPDTAGTCKHGIRHPCIFPTLIPFPTLVTDERGTMLGLGSPVNGACWNRSPGLGLESPAEAGMESADSFMASGYEG